jgi:hypothetical protein
MSKLILSAVGLILIGSLALRAETTPNTPPNGKAGMDIRAIAATIDMKALPQVDPPPEGEE